MSETDFLGRLRDGEALDMNDPEYGKQIGPQVDRAFALLRKLNDSASAEEVREHLSELIGEPVDPTTTVFPPLYTNYGQNLKLGKNVFINHACSLLDLGGITIEDGTLIGPRVNITSENHPVELAKRNTLVPGAVLIERNVWVGAGATILLGVTVGEGSVVAAGAVVTRDVPPNTLVGGTPAKVLKTI